MQRILPSYCHFNRITITSVVISCISPFFPQLLSAHITQGFILLLPLLFGLPSTYETFIGYKAWWETVCEQQCIQRRPRLGNREPAKTATRDIPSFWVKSFSYVQIAMYRPGVSHILPVMLLSCPFSSSAEIHTFDLKGTIVFFW